MTGAAKKTVSRLAVELGMACEAFADRVMVDLPCTHIQCDEIWAFCGAKEKNVPRDQKGQGRGDVWTWVAIDPETKLIPRWWVGDRTAETAYKFLRGLEWVKHPIPLSSHHPGPRPRLKRPNPV